MTQETQAELNEKLYLSAASLNMDAMAHWLAQGADATYQSSRSLVFCIGLGCYDGAKMLLPHSNVEEVAESFLKDEVGFEPDDIGPTLDWFGQHLPPSLQDKWVEKYGEFCPHTKALSEQRHLAESLPTAANQTPIFRL